MVEVGLWWVLKASAWFDNRDGGFFILLVWEPKREVIMKEKALLLTIIIALAVFLVSAHP
jgi:hypothetical protein